MSQTSTQLREMHRTALSLSPGLSIATDTMNQLAVLLLQSTLLDCNLPLCVAVGALLGDFQSQHSITVRGIDALHVGILWHVKRSRDVLR